MEGETVSQPAYPFFVMNDNCVFWHKLLKIAVEVNAGTGCNNSFEYLC